jgi:hypothetical protein
MPHTGLRGRLHAPDSRTEFQQEHSPLTLRVEIMMKKAQGLLTAAPRDQEALRRRIEHAQGLRVSENQMQRKLGPITPKAAAR